MGAALKSQDVLLLLKLAAGGDPTVRQLDLSRALGISQAEVHHALRRVCRAGLFVVEPMTSHDSLSRRPRAASAGRVRRDALLEFLVHGLKYVFPATLGGASRGVPTAWGAPPLDAQMVSGDDVPVWPAADGSHRGPAVEPLYPTAPQAALRDPRLYTLLALVDGIRVGRARERELATDSLRRLLAP